jgi:hypothetical protein
MTYRIGNKVFTVKETNGRYFYWSPRALRWLPVYARAPPPEPNWKIAHTIVKALNEAAQSQGSAAAGPHSSSLSTGL